MSLMHHILSGSLRVLGRDRDAAEVEAAAAAASEGSRPSERSVEEIPLAAPDSAPAPRMIFTESDHSAMAGAPGSSSGSSSGRSESSFSPSSSPSAPAEAGAAGSGGAASTDLTGSAGGGSAQDAGPADEKEGKPEAATDVQAQPVEQPAVTPDLHADPLAGIYSDRVRERIEQDAFRSASRTAQDSEIARRAADLLPPELRSVLQHTEPHLDVSPAARSARIEALNGEIPRWAKGSPEHDPSIIRVLEGSSAQSHHLAGHSRPSVEMHAAPSAQAPDRASDRGATSSPEQPSTQPSASPSRFAAGRELDR